MNAEPDCLFCQMSSGAFPVDKLHEDGLAFTIRDIAPRAPVHMIVIPKQHIESARELDNQHGPLLAHLFRLANQTARDLDIAESGYRLTFNVGDDGGQTIHHLHLHLLGGHKLGPEA